MSLKNKKDLYFLVTTALYETWNEKEQTIFLGEWCLIFNKFDKNKHPNYMVHPYHWDDRSKYNSDFDLIDSLYEKKLLELMKLLNQFHGVNNNIKYWRVIIGPWLRSFIEILFDRYEVLKSVKYKVSNSLILDYNLNDFIPLNNIKFSKQIKTDDWNHVIFAEIIKSLNIPYSNLGIKIINQKSPSQPLINNLIFLIKNFLLKIYSSVFTKHLNKVLIKDAYMPIWNEVKLNLLFSQLPVRTPISSVEKPKIITDFRNSRKILQSNSDFEKLLNRLLINLMPFSYLENLEKIKKETNLYYPKNPKIIFTSNAYHHNDNFKIMTAERRVKNTPYVIGQHGGGFRNTLKDQTVLHQLKSCDKFFSWGWTDKLFFKNKVQRLPSLKLSRKIENPKSNGHILITTPSYPRYFYCHFTTPVAGQLLQILNNILYFIENLDSKEIIKIKLDSEEVLSPQGNLKSSISRPISLGWNIRDRFLSKGLSHALSEGENFNQLLKESRLSVATYNSTIYYETLAANFPTVIFFDSSLYEINEEAKVYFNLLESVGIFHKTPKSASNFINSIFDDVNEWWLNEDVQNARISFCETYALTSKTYLRDWKFAINKIIKE
jgi:putative transferase (TIGR04331 family)